MYFGHVLRGTKGNALKHQTIINLCPREIETVVAQVDGIGCPFSPLPDSSSSAITVARCLSSCLPSSAITECNSVSRSSCLAACCSTFCSARAAWSSARTKAASVASLARVSATNLAFNSATSDRNDDRAAACSCNTRENPLD